jgi:hypothetical protein
MPAEKQMLYCPRRNCAAGQIAFKNTSIMSFTCKAGQLSVLPDGHAGQLTGIRDSRVVDEHVEAAKLLADALRRGGDRSLIRHVELQQRAAGQTQHKAVITVAMDRRGRTAAQMSELLAPPAQAPSPATCGEVGIGRILFGCE